jgi:hypothetical protein
MATAVLAGCMVAPGIPVPVLLAPLFVMGLISPHYQGQARGPARELAFAAGSCRSEAAAKRDRHDLAGPLKDQPCPNCTGEKNLKGDLS